MNLKDRPLSSQKVEKRGETPLDDFGRDVMDNS
jgi:hypothetical protein